MSSTSLSPDAPVTITAVVTDPDGIEDLIGGELFDVASGAVYGSFMTAAGEGAYSLVVTWDQADAMTTIDAPGAGASRDLRARFFDTAGNTAEQDIALLLRCQDDGSVSACGGRCDGTARCGSSCVDTTSNDNNCGACDFRCVDPSPEYAARCTNSVCTWSAQGRVRQSCDALCTSQGGECLPGSPEARYCRSSCSSSFYTYPDCGAVPAATSMASGSGDFNSLQCECGLSATGVLCAPGPEDNDERCSDGCSNDGDTYIDCADFDCNGTVVCSR
ncbi:MAG: hypothetical protein GXP55_14170 [Deltaproteobacteria bacterium]|nr:hypothetical protein [Deltaproteobacteria bacterium]